MVSPLSPMSCIRLGQKELTSDRKFSSIHLERIDNRPHFGVLLQSRASRTLQRIIIWLDVTKDQ